MERRRWLGRKMSAKDHRMVKYGMTGDDYVFMHDYQQGQCGICKTPQAELKRALAVDHCHETGRVRGLLCSNCNTALGLFKDRKELLERAARWLMTEDELT